MNTQMKKLVVLGALAAAVAGLAVACGNSSTGSSHINGGDGDVGDGDGDAGNQGGDGDGDAGNHGGDGDGDAGNHGGDGDSGTPSGDCFNGTPTKMEDFLNRCTNATTTDKTPVIPKANKDGTVTHIDNAL